MLLLTSVLHCVRSQVHADDATCADARTAAVGAYVCAVFFVALMLAFGAAGDAPNPALVLTIGVIGVLAHLPLLPAVAATATRAWMAVGGYAWIAIDVTLNVASINGAELRMVMPFRLGGHIFAALWIGGVSWDARGPIRPFGLLLAAVLTLYSFVAPWLPAWALFVLFPMVPIWLALLGRMLQLRSKSEV